MEIGKVVKKVVSTIKNEAFSGCPLLLVQPLNMKFENKGSEVLCVDFMGASADEIVMIMKEGSSVNDMMGLEEAPADAAIIGIVDRIVLDDKSIYEKSVAE